MFNTICSDSFLQGFDQLMLLDNELRFNLQPDPEENK